MKTYEEMAKSALTRGKAVRKQRNKRNKVIFGAASGLVVCGMAILLVFGLAGKNHGGPLNYGPVKYLSLVHKTDARVTGKPCWQIGSYSDGTSSSPPMFEFGVGGLNVVARAVEECPEVYESLNEYGSTETTQYRLFRMEVIDPLQSGMEGTFYYLLPAHLKGDLTQYDALLICMKQLPKNYVLRVGDQLKAFEYLYGDSYDTPQLGNIIAFTDGIFDESLWQDKSWYYGYQFGKHYLDENDERLLVSRGFTLEEALQRRLRQRDEWLGDGAAKDFVQVNHYDYQTEAAQQAMAYMKPFENGVFIPERDVFRDYYAHRYINGCPTNEWVRIDLENETVTASDYRFEDADFENLPDISSYIASLDLKQIMPQHTNPRGKLLIYNSAVGWYEKTETGVYSIVRIAWSYFDEDDYYTGYYDETFILLDETGDHIISRGDLIDLIGKNPNIYHGEYGAAEPLPMI